MAYSRHISHENREFNLDSLSKFVNKLIGVGQKIPISLWKPNRKLYASLKRIAAETDGEHSQY